MRHLSKQVKIRPAFLTTGAAFSQVVSSYESAQAHGCHSLTLVLRCSAHRQFVVVVFIRGDKIAVSDVTLSAVTEDDTGQRAVETQRQLLE